ncbi:MAG: hypothetical protein ACRDR6_04560 [Pseudonocardiaceae bacterium]
MHPFLTGEHTLEELTEALPAGQRDMVVLLVRTLHEQGFVIDARADQQHCRDGDQHVVIDQPAPVTDGALAALVEAAEVVLQVCAPAGPRHPVDDIRAPLSAH